MLCWTFTVKEFLNFQFRFAVFFLGLNIKLSFVICTSFKLKIGFKVFILFIKIIQLNFLTLQTVKLCLISDYLVSSLTTRQFLVLVVLNNTIFNMMNLNLGIGWQQIFSIVMCCLIGWFMQWAAALCCLRARWFRCKFRQPKSFCCTTGCLFRCSGAGKYVHRKIAAVLILYIYV